MATPTRGRRRTSSSRRVPHDRLTRQRHLSLVVVGVRGKPHTQRIASEHGLGHVAPLHHGYGVVLHQLTDGEVGDLTEAIETIEIGMEKRGYRRGAVALPVDRGGRRRTRVGAHERERRAGDVIGHPEARRDPLGQRGLPRSQIAAEQHHVPGMQSPRHGGAQGPGVLGRLRPQPYRGGLPGPAHAGSPTRSRLARTKSARISATTSAPPRNPAAGWYVGTR